MSNFLKRFITSLILIPILFFGIFKGDYIFLLFVTLVILISFKELSKIIINKDSNQLFLGYILTLSIPIASYIEIELFVNISLFLIILYFVRIIYKKISISNFWSSYIFISLYSGFGLSFAIIIRNEDNGLILVCIPIIISSVNDIMAYLIGKNFGQNLAFPNVSPNKTFEGAFGGIISSIISSYVLFSYLDINIGLLKMIFIGLIVSLMGIFGDFFESLIKRKSGIKDTGNLLPGHGGMVDRVDSLIFILPIFYLIILSINVV